MKSNLDIYMEFGVLNSFEDNKIVIEFINSVECYKIEQLKEFIQIHNLPYEEKWFFYLIGKRFSSYESYSKNFKLSIEDSFNEHLCYIFGYDHSNNIYPPSKISGIAFNYGNDIIGDIYYWKKYLSNIKKNKSEAKAIIKPVQHNKDWVPIPMPASPKYSLNIFKEGYLYVDKHLKSDINNLMLKYSRDEYYRDEYYRRHNDSCELCQMEPCMCSDSDPG